MLGKFEGTYKHWLEGQIKNPAWLLIVEVNRFEYPPVAGSKEEVTSNFLGFILCNILGFLQTKKLFTEKIDEDWKIKLQKIEDEKLVTHIYTYKNDRWHYKKSVLDDMLKDGG